METYAELNKRIQTVKQTQLAFIQYLKTLSIQSREELRQMDFQNYITKKAPWLNEMGKGDHIAKTNYPTNLPKISRIEDLEIKVNELVLQIEKNPSRQSELLLEFLSNFRMINEADRRVLVDSFRTLDAGTLKKELIELYTTFCVDEAHPEEANKCI